MPHCAGLHLELEQALPASIDQWFNKAYATEHSLLKTLRSYPSPKPELSQLFARGFAGNPCSYHTAKFKQEVAKICRQLDTRALSPAVCCPTSRSGKEALSLKQLFIAVSAIARRPDSSIVKLSSTPNYHIKHGTDHNLAFGVLEGNMYT